MAKVSTKAIEKAVEAAGGQAQLARRISEITGKAVKQQNVWNWLFRRGSIVPAELVIPIEKAVDGKVSRHEIRPDIYPADAA